ncbi:MAG: hypothetical protein KU38_00175 [Sulfurovum sp. FS08-3]|nr:MAG: hypothetical protein KU38_00175 [Sulfurovum sp. FS08-3]
MKSISERLNGIFEKETKLNIEKIKLDKKFDKLYSKINSIAFELYQEFIETNQNFSRDEEYYKIYLQPKSLLAEELIFDRMYEDFIEFKHKSPHRKNHTVSVYFDIKENDYNSNGAVVDKNQYDRLSKDFAINIRA